MSDIVQVFSAGSLRHAMPEIADAFRQRTGITALVSLGPAGLLRERIEAGEPFDLFASANMAHPRRLVVSGLAQEAVCFARNRLGVLARADLGLRADDFVKILSDQTVAIGISTPKDDPSGDYAFEMFGLMDARHPGLGEALKSRARQLVGGRHSPAGKGTADLVKEGVVDLFVGYASYSHLYEEDPLVRMIEIPAEFSPDIQYGLALRPGASDQAGMLRDFLLSADGQAILMMNGFLPVAP